MRALDYQRGAWRPGSKTLAAELAAAGFGRNRRFTSGQPVLTNGIPGQHVALITGGLVKVTMSSADGPAAASSDKGGILLSIRGPGDLLGEEAVFLDETSPTGYLHSPGSLRATALTPGSARVFPAEQFERYLRVQQPGFLWMVVQGLCERLADAEARIASAARDNADCRLARLLCDLERHGIPDYNWGPGTQLPLNLSQAELASWIGSCRETVDRTFTRWRRRRIISTRRRTIIVHDLEALARIAGIQVSRQAWSLTRGPRGRTIA
jgi:CRP-like cAMP-binding protein